MAGFCCLDVLCSVHFEGLKLLKCGLSEGLIERCEKCEKCEVLWCVMLSEKDDCEGNREVEGVRSLFIYIFLPRVRHGKGH